jgi:uncharacterized protein (TIGR00251 family)
MVIVQKDQILILHVKVVPNSSRTQIVGPLGDALKIKVAPPPEDGKANAAVLAALAEALQLPATAITLATGHSRPLKTLHITGITLDAARQRLGVK